MLKLVLSVVREVQRLQLKLSSWLLPRLRPLHSTCRKAAHVKHKFHGRVGACYI